jgi:acyl-CoA thioesterase FadM
MRAIATGIEYTTHHTCGFRDVDPYGHMNMVTYYAEFTDHRFTALRERFGLDLNAIRKLPIAFFTTKVEIEYRRPVLCDEKYSITSKVTGVDEQVCEIEAVLAKSDGTVAARCRFLATCVDMATGRRTSWPAGFVERFYVADA